MGLTAGAIYTGVSQDALQTLVHTGLVNAKAMPDASGSGLDMEGACRIGTMNTTWRVALLSSRCYRQIRSDGFSDKLRTASLGGRIFFWFTASSTGEVLFELHEDGVLCRRWAESEGQVLANLGTPLAEEAGLVEPEQDGGPMHDEWSMLELAERLTGISEDQHFHMLGPTWPVAPP